MDRKTEIENIVKKLPVNFYTKEGTKYKVSVIDGSDATYINFLENSINVGVKTLDKFPTIEEPNVRTLFYHEVSHGILTDINNFSANNYSMDEIRAKANELNLGIKGGLGSNELHQVLNIVEDERIETLLDGYYLDVDFRNFIRTIAESGDSKFFDLIRMGEGDRNLYDIAINPLLKDEATYKDYLPAIVVYLHLRDSENEEEQEPESEKGDEGEGSGNQDESLEDGPSEEVDSEEEKRKAQEDLVKKSVNKKRREQENKAMKAKNEELGCSEMDIDLLIKKIALKGKVKAPTGSRAKSWDYNQSGIDIHRFDDLVGNQYKFFKKPSNRGEGKSKSIINFYIDSSGSFEENEGQVNEMLIKLMDLEKKYKGFEFTLTAFSYNNERVLKGDGRLISAGGGTFISRRMEEIFKIHDLPNTYNILMIDGITGTEDGHLNYFDKRNTYICSDESNRDLFEDFKNAKVDLVSGGYVQHIEKFIKKSLNSILRKI